MNCYRVKVETTNASNDTFSIDREDGNEDYGECDDGEVYVLAESAKEAATQLDGAGILEIARVGIGFVPEERKDGEGR